MALTLFFVVVLGLIYFAMRKNWEKKSQQDSYLVDPQNISQRKEMISYFGTYIATTYANDWLHRVHAHGLALTSKAQLKFFEDGIGLQLASKDFFIPFEDIISLSSTHALAGKVFETDGLIAITWKLGEVAVVSGFRTERTSDHLEILTRGAKIG
jgi:hypothetical protein